MMAAQHPTGSPARQCWRRLRANRAAMSGLGILILFGTLAILAPVIAPIAPETQNLERGAIPPSSAHWLGTDRLGRDLFARLLFGSRLSLLVGISATAVSLLIGVTYGALAGYAGGRVDSIMMRLVDVLYALPFTLFVIILMVVFGRELVLLFVAIGAVEWLTMARIVRSQVMTVKQQLFVTAARALGFSHGRLVWRHIVPNCIGPVVVYATLTVPRVILLESFLSFLGLGVQPPMASWGVLIRDGARAMESAPWLLIAPALTLSLTLFALNFLGDGLRDALDPRFRG